MQLRDSIDAAFVPRFHPCDRAILCTESVRLIAKSIILKSLSWAVDLSGVYGSVVAHPHTALIVQHVGLVKVATKSCDPRLQAPSHLFCGTETSEDEEPPSGGGVG